MKKEIPENYYFHGEIDKILNFYQMPAFIMTHPVYSKISDSAKILYMLLLNRMRLSALNGWKDEKGRTYMIYSNESVMEDMRIGKNKASVIFMELVREGLIEKKRIVNKPSRIYVLNFAEFVENLTSNARKNNDKSCFDNDEKNYQETGDASYYDNNMKNFSCTYEKGCFNKYAKTLSETGDASYFYNNVENFTETDNATYFNNNVKTLSETDNASYFNNNVKNFSETGDASYFNKDVKNFSCTYEKGYFDNDAENYQETDIASYFNNNAKTLSETDDASYFNNNVKNFSEMDDASYFYNNVENYSEADNTSYFNNNRRNFSETDNASYYNNDVKNFSKTDEESYYDNDIKNFSYTDEKGYFNNDVENLWETDNASYFSNNVEKYSETGEEYYSETNVENYVENYADIDKECNYSDIFAENYAERYPSTADKCRCHPESVSAVTPKSNPLSTATGGDNKNNINKNNKSNIYINHIYHDGQAGGCTHVDFENYEEMIRTNIHYDDLCDKYTDSERECLDELVTLIAETVTFSKKPIRINGTSYPAETVKSRFLKLVSRDIEAVIDWFFSPSISSGAFERIKNIRAYLISMLFNCKTTRNTGFRNFFNSTYYSVAV